MMSDDYPHDYQDPSVGITFHLPSYREFVPNAWLLHARLNRQATKIEVHYTHCLVTIEGMNLGKLHEQIGKFGVSWVRELRVPKPDALSVTRIEIAEKTDG
jgi:hypothetical protein